MRYTTATRKYLTLSIALGLVTAILVVAQAALLAAIITSAFSTTLVTTLAAVVVLRAATHWYGEVIANRSSAKAKSQLRVALVEHIATLGPYALGRKDKGALITLMSQGIDALDNYFSRYLAQLVLALIVPVVILSVIASQDWLSAAIIVATIPLIPIFMVLIGLATRNNTERQLITLQRLSGHFLDVVSGLPTLKIFGRSKAQIETIATTTDAYRKATMKTLRVTFLSSLVLELLASIAVAIVAVSIGLRLLSADIALRQGLFILILAPEAYLPLRMVGTNYHASADGLAAATQIFEILEEPLPARGSNRNIPDLSVSTIKVNDLQVSYPELEKPALDNFSLTIEPGDVVAITGRSGCGKSSLLGVLHGFITPGAGTVQVGEKDLKELDPDVWRTRVAVVPQRPHIFAMSVIDNVRLGRPSASDEAVREAMDLAGLSTTSAAKSAGERQRIAIARAFLMNAPLLLLDEPTAALDGHKETQIIEALKVHAKGRTVVMVTHRSALLDIADRVVDMNAIKVSI